MSPLRPAAAALVLLLLTAGCLGGPTTGATPTDTPTATPTPEPPGTPDSTETPDPTRYDHDQAADQPDPDKSVKVENGWDRSVTMHVRVIREATNETVHDDVHELGPGEEGAVYNTMAADPDGVERFTVVATVGNTTERVTIETSECYGDAYAEVQDDGSLYLYYAIC